jgi:hypothetical protein
MKSTVFWVIISHSLKKPDVLKEQIIPKFVAGFLLGLLFHPEDRRYVPQKCQTFSDFAVKFLVIHSVIKLLGPDLLLLEKN